MKKNIKIPKQIKSVAIIFFIIGALTLFLTLAIINAPLKTTFGGKTQIYGLSIPENAYNIFMGILIILSGLYILEGVLLFKLIKFGFWLGIILSVFMISSFPIGTILAVVNIYLLLKNRTVFLKAKP